MDCSMPIMDGFEASKILKGMMASKESSGDSDHSLHGFCPRERETASAGVWYGISFSETIDSREN